MIAQNIWLWAQIGALAFFGSLAVSGFMAIAGLGDAPDDRSAHSGTIPTAGGVGILAGVGMSLCALNLLFPDLPLPRSFASVMALLFSIGLLGLADDAFALGPKLKFGVMVLICAAAVWLIGAPDTLPYLRSPIPIPALIGFSGAMLWIFVVMNAVNFMDGANGMMGLTLTVGNFALFGAGLIGGAPTTILLSGLSLMALLGFIPYNLRKRATLFAGDVGSLSLSFLFAISVLFLIAETPDATYHLIGPVLLLPFLTDVLLTLVRRVRNRDNLLKSHNTHLYQRLIRKGVGHLTVSWFYALAGLVCANIVVIGAPRGWFATLHVTLILVGGFVAAYILISRALADKTSTNSGDNKAG